MTRLAQRQAWEDLWRRLGLAGVALAVLGGSGLVALSVPWLGTADEPHHLDYAASVFGGSLPVWGDGPTIEVGRSLPSAQLASNHPPLYYAILAPAVGPALSVGKWKMATALGRIVTMALGIVAVYATSWAALQVTGSPFHAVSVPALLASFTPVALFAGLVHNDVLLVLFVSLGLGVAVRILLHDASWNAVASASLIAALGMSTRVSFIGSFAAIGLAISLHLFGETDADLFLRLRRTVNRIALVVVAVLMFIGWFYWRNFQLSGDFFRAVPQENPGELLGRSYRSAVEVLTSRDFGLLLPTSLYGRQWPPEFASWRLLGLSVNQWASIVVLSTGLVLCSIWIARHKRLVLRASWRLWAVAFLLLVQVPLALAQQWVHATGYGGINARYLLPAFFVLALLLSMGASSLGTGRYFFVVPVVIVSWLFLVLYLASLLHSRWNLVLPRESFVPLAAEMVSMNSFPGGVGVLAVLVLAAGLAIQFLALWRLRDAPGISLSLLDSAAEPSGESWRNRNESSLRTKR